MLQTKYLVVGGSHAGIEAVQAIRMRDGDGALMLATRESALPYSPTVLPYIVSGRADPARIPLRDESYFARHHVEFRRGATLGSLDTEHRVARFSDGAEVGYEKLLLATGAKPAIPAIAGLQAVPFHVLRTLDDALGLRDSIRRARRAVVLGAGLVGMHAAENLVEAGAEVTVVEMGPHVLPAYFDQHAARLIERAFARRGAKILCGRRAASAQAEESGFSLELEGGERVHGDFLLIGAGVTPVTDYLDGTAVAKNRGILVDRRMRTSVAGVWAAGDVSEAPSFYGEDRVLNGIVPNATDQGRIAGMDMAGDEACGDFRGAVPVNTYRFFGSQALSVGTSEAPGAEIATQFDAAADRYLKVVLRQDRLLGIFGVNMPFDPGIMLELILRRVDLAPMKQEFVRRPQQAARALMSRIWR